MTPFEERLLETLFPDFVAWSTESVATYVLFIRDGNPPVFFKKMTDDILEVALRHASDLAVYAVKTDGNVDDVTEAWKRVFDKHKTTRRALDELVIKWGEKVSSDVATYEVKEDRATLGYFSFPSLDILRRADRVRDIRRLSVLAIAKNGTILDVSQEWRPMFEEYIAIRSKNVVD